jgi:hypothetical protein
VIKRFTQANPAKEIVAVHLQPDVDYMNITAIHHGLNLIFANYLQYGLKYKDVSPGSPISVLPLCKCWIFSVNFLEKHKAWI